jgi:hypothetical protein
MIGKSLSQLIRRGLSPKRQIKWNLGLFTTCLQELIRISMPFLHRILSCAPSFPWEVSQLMRSYSYGVNWYRHCLKQHCVRQVYTSSKN